MKGSIGLATMAILGLGLVASSSVFAELATPAEGSRAPEPTASKDALSPSAPFSAASRHRAIPEQSRTYQKHTDIGHWMKIHGYLQFDENVFMGSRANRSAYPSTSNIRRARLELEGGLHKGMKYNFDVEFADEARGVFLPRATVTFPVFQDVSLIVGQHKPAFNMHWNQSSKNTLFLENDLNTNAFSPDYSLGVSVLGSGRVLGFMATMYHERDGVNPSTPAAGASGLVSSANLSFSGRVWFSPAHRHAYATHLGFYGLYQNQDDRNNTTQFTTNPEGLAKNTRLTSSVIPVNTVSNWRTLGFEVAGLWGPITGQADVSYTRVERIVGTSNLNYKGASVQASYLLTKEHRVYNFKQGIFDGVHPHARRGALEVVGRYSYVDLNAGAALGPTERNLTVGLNWWCNGHVRLMSNYVRARITNRAAGTYNRSFDILGLRLQAAW